MTTTQCIRDTFTLGPPLYYSAANFSIPLFYNKFLEVPISKDTFEIPICLLRAIKSLDVSKIDALVIPLAEATGYSPYSSLEASIKFGFQVKYNLGCIKLQIPHSSTFYYCTTGAIWDSNWNLICISSWQAHKEQLLNTEKETIILDLPIVHILPTVFIDKADALQKFIIGKYLKTLLSIEIYNGLGEWHKPSVRIEEIPFKVKSVKHPSINTTNEKLIEILQNYQNEICK